MFDKLSYIFIITFSILWVLVALYVGSFFDGEALATDPLEGLSVIKLDLLNDTE